MDQSDSASAIGSGRVRDGVTAQARFGLGPAPGVWRSIASDPRGYVRAQLDDPQAALIREPGLLGYYEIQVRDESFLGRQRIASLGNQPDKSEERERSEASLAKLSAQMDTSPLAEDGTGRGSYTLYRSEVGARIRHGARTEAPFLERWVLFWDDHFTASAYRNGRVQLFVGAREREKIRPHVLGSFRDLLRAATLDPAMLDYLNNDASVGPGSPAAKRNASLGLNENLGRELLELHTVGVNGGYHQADVIEAAKILTGWRGSKLQDLAERPDLVTFARGRHEPGDRVVLGATYRGEAPEAIDALLDDLARHPATARFVATKIARSFVSSEPPADLVDRLERTFVDTDGDLAALAAALVASDPAWEAPARKIVPPYDFVVSLVRALRADVPDQRMLWALTLLGQRPFEAPSPAGWPLEDDAWLQSSAILERFDVALDFVRRFGGDRDPVALYDDLFPPEVDPHARQSIARAESRQTGVALALMTPAQLRR